MHLIPPSASELRIIDSDRVCDAVAALGEPSVVLDWSTRFALVADPTRLALLLCIRHVGPISVSDLAAATQISDTTASQALRFLRARGAVSAARDGRVVRYTLADPDLLPLLDAVSPNPLLHHASGPSAAHTG